MTTKTETISELVENQSAFASTGYAKVKATRAGRGVRLRLPIKSTGVAELQERLSGNAPRPPVIEKLITAQSDIGKAMGLARDKVCMVFDTTDEAYIKAQNEHAAMFAWKIVVFALDVVWKKADGTVADTFADKLRILQAAGITTSQRDEIYSAIGRLTRFSEEEQDFLSES